MLNIDQNQIRFYYFFHKEPKKLFYGPEFSPANIHSLESIACFLFIICMLSFVPFQRISGMGCEATRMTRMRKSADVLRLNVFHHQADLPFFSTNHANPSFFIFSPISVLAGHHHGFYFVAQLNQLKLISILKFLLCDFRKSGKFFFRPVCIFIYI